MEKQLALDHFSNQLALEMGLKIVNLAQERSLQVGVEISRINHTVFLFMDDGLSVDKHNWLRRKANVAVHFEESSLSVKTDLATGDMTLEDPFGLDERDYIAKGGSIPIMVTGAGLVGTITVTGLPDVEDHQLIVDALSAYFES